MPKVRSVFLFAVIMLLDFTLQVCHKSCNNNGFCYVENGIEKCECLDRISVGESCKEFVNYCDDNPCANGGKCIPEAGQYNCLCAKDFYGQNCTFKQNLFSQMYLQYNHIAPVGSNDNNFLIILTDLGSVESIIEMVTSEYAIAGGLTIPSDSKDFVQTNNIRAIARQLNVPISPSIPTGTVYYHAGKYRMSTPGTAIVTVTITDILDSSIYYIWYFQFGSLKNDGCNPMIKIRNCGVPSSPIFMNVKQSVFVEANVQRDCGRDSNISYNWSISNYFDTKTLQWFNESSRSLKIPPFGIRIKYKSDDVFSVYNVIKLVSLEQSADGTRYGEAVNRVIDFFMLDTFWDVCFTCRFCMYCRNDCYISVILDSPIAKITGGKRQEFSNRQQISMDGSDSVDMSVHPKINQRLMYLWRCSSANDAGEYCRNLNETDSH